LIVFVELRKAWFSLEILAYYSDIKRGDMMKPAGVVRKVDQLGRIVLPKSLRKRYLMNEGDPVEIFVQGDHIILERYRPKCVFCGSMVEVAEFKEKYVCDVCMTEMDQLKQA